MISQQDLSITIGQANGSGIDRYVYFIPSDKIKGWPAIAYNMANASRSRAYIGYDGSFSLADGANWIRIYNTQGEGVLSATPIGTRDGIMYENRLRYRFPKLTSKAAMLSDAIVNGDGVFVAWHNGFYRVIGNKHYRCDVTPSVMSGDSAGSSKGIVFEATCPDHKALPIYEGLLRLENSILDCTSNQLINFEDMITNKTEDYTNRIEGGNTVSFVAMGTDGRIHIEGSGPITMEVSVDGVSYATVEHDVTFDNGVAIAPLQLYIGDYVRISATTLTKVIINYNNIKTY